MEFTKEEKEKIYKAQDVMIADLERIRQESQLDSVVLKLNLYGIGECYTSFIPSFDWNLCLTPKQICYHNESYCNEYTIVLSRKDILNNIHPNRKLSLEAISYLIEQYPWIRKKLIEKINNEHLENERQKINDAEAKKRRMEKIREVTQNYDREASIEIDLPKTQNRHQIEVTTEEGRKVGIIDFGGRTIKIITDGNIVLVDKSEKDNSNQNNHSKSISQR